MAREAGHAHHIFFYRRLHEANQDNKDIRRMRGFIPRLDEDSHAELHRAVPGVPPLDIYTARRVKGILVPTMDVFEAVDDFCFAVEEAAKSPKSHELERKLGYLTIETVRLQLPFIQEGLIDVRVQG